MIGQDKFKEIFDEYKDKRKILFYGDPDVDGLMSLLLMCQWGDMMGLSYTYYVNDDRYHGFTIDPKKLDGYLVIAADFTITEKEMQALVDSNVVVLSTDHHTCQKEFIDVSNEEKGTRGIVINNQYPFESETDEFLSGAGVFYELICSLYPEFKSDVREAIVGITLLSDVRAIENNNKARRYLNKAFRADTSQGYIKYLVQSTIGNDFGFGTPKLDRNFIDYKLSPYINALLRANKTAEAIDFVLGRGAIGSEYRDLQKELTEVMKARASKLELPNIAILAVNELDFLEYKVKISSYIGLLCSAWKDGHQGISVLGFTYGNGKITRCSFRGRFDDIHYQTGFRNLGIHAEGHPTAFGIQDFEPTQDTWNELNDLIGELEEGHHETIKIIPVSNFAVYATQHGMETANHNIYVRDMYRTYWKYTGTNYKVVQTTYKEVEFTDDDYKAGRVADRTYKGKSYKYLKDENGKPIAKYIKYLVDGREVKSFGTPIEEGLILPVLEKGYVSYQVKNPLYYRED